MIDITVLDMDDCIEMALDLTQTPQQQDTDNGFVGTSLVRKNPHEPASLHEQALFPVCLLRNVKSIPGGIALLARKIGYHEHH